MLVRLARLKGSHQLGEPSKQRQSLKSRATNNWERNLVGMCFWRENLWNSRQLLTTTARWKRVSFFSMGTRDVVTNGP